MAFAAIFLVAGCEDGPLSLAPGNPASMAASVAPAEFGPCGDPADCDALMGELISAINSERRKAGVSPLQRNPVLTAVADFYGCRLIDGAFFGHVDPFDGSSVDHRAADFGYVFAKIGENLAAGQQTPQEAVANWMASPKHRANMLDPAFTEIGVAVKDGGEFRRYWVDELGRPLNLDVPGLRPLVPASAPSTDAPSSRPGSTQN